MARLLIDNDLWAAIEPLLPPPKPRRKDHPGRKPADPRRRLTGIVFVLKTSIQWEDVPVEMGVCADDALTAPSRLACCGRMGRVARGIVGTAARRRSH